MERPVPISPDTLDRIESLAPGEGVKWLEIWRREYSDYVEAVQKDAAERVREIQHLRTYRVLTVMSGTFLAAASLAVCAFAIWKGASLAPLAAVLAPIAGIAGVFVWGYRPK